MLSTDWVLFKVKAAVTHALERARTNEIEDQHMSSYPSQAARVAAFPREILPEQVIPNSSSCLKYGMKLKLNCDDIFQKAGPSLITHSSRARANYEVYVTISIIMNSEIDDQYPAPTKGFV